MKSFFYCSKAEKFSVRNQNGSNPSPPIIIKKGFYMKSFFYCSKAEKIFGKKPKWFESFSAHYNKKGFLYEILFLLQ